LKVVESIGDHTTTIAQKIITDTPNPIDKSNHKGISNGKNKSVMKVEDHRDNREESSKR
jgi:hypothetical protein